MPKIRPAASRLAFAVALATTAAVSMTAAATPAFAQKKGKEQEAPKANYSKAFIVAYQPVSKIVTDGTDLAAAKAQLPAVTAAAETPDDKFAAGQLTFNVGAKSSDVPLQRQGLDLMLDSGKTPAGDLARTSFAAASRLSSRRSLQ